MLFFVQTFVHSSAHTLLVVILERLKFFCELSVREPFSSLDGLVERNLNKKEWQYRTWNFIKRTFLKCCTLLTGGKKAPPDRPEHKNSFLDQTQSPRSSGVRIRNVELHFDINFSLCSDN